MEKVNKKVNDTKGRIEKSYVKTEGQQQALRDKANDEMVVAALIHDIGDELAPLNHSEYAATVLKPYVTEKTHWVIEKHGEFQMYYYAHHLGGNKNQREKYKGHKYYQDTVDFCENWDQKSFDPNYKSLPLKEFEPLIKKIFAACALILFIITSRAVCNVSLKSRDVANS